MTTGMTHPHIADAQARYAGKTVLITGASGYIGAALGRALQGVAARLVLLIRPHPGTAPPLQPIQQHDTTVTIAGDVTDINVWRHVLPNIDYVFHLAAYEHRHGYQHHPLTDVYTNAIAVLHLLEVCRQEGLTPTISFASSSNLVGLPETLPVTEQMPAHPLTIYAIHKLMAEQYLLHYWREFQIPSVTLRLANVYGPSPNVAAANRATLNAIIHRAVQNESLTLFRNHSCIRDYIFIDDVVNAFLVAGINYSAREAQIFLIGSGIGYTIADVIKLIAMRTELRMGHHPVITINREVPIEPVGWRQFVADTSRFKTATGWTARVALVDGIDRTLNWLLLQHAGGKP